MNEAAQGPKSVAFGPFEIDLDTEELRRNGVPVRLPAQAHQILRLLLSRPGELVSRQELKRALWPDSSFGDFEHGLNAAVNRLREVLGDSVEAPRFIETLPRRGYRFIAALDAPRSLTPSKPDQPSPTKELSTTELPTTIAGANPSDEPAAIKRFLSRFALPPILVTVAAFALVILLVAVRQRRAVSNTSGSDADRDDSAVQVTPLTSLPGQEVAPSLSPDGSEVVFSWDRNVTNKHAVFDLYVKVVGSEHVQQLTHHPAESIIPAWSPDGRSIAFVRNGGGVGGVFLISPLGGPERKIADPPVKNPFLYGLSWSSDGERIAFADSEGMRVVSVADGVVRPIQEPPGCHLPGTLAFSPDGQWLAFTCYIMESSDLEVMPASGGWAKKVIRVQGGPTTNSWSADSKRIIYSANGRLFSVSREGGRPSLLTFAHDAYSPAVAPRGDRLAYVVFGGSLNLWRIDLRQASRGAVAPLNASSRWQDQPDISPDGKKIAFESNRSGRDNVWVSNLDGSEAIELTTFQALSGTPRWSPDGRRIAFDSREGGRVSIYIIDPEERIPRRIDTGSLSAEVPNWSRDGKWIYFNTYSPDDPFIGTIYKISPEGGAPKQITSTLGTNAQEDPAGRTLYFNTGSFDSRLRALDLGTGQERDLEGMPHVNGPKDWAVVSHGIYFIDSAAEPATINFYDFGTHKVTKRMPLPKHPESGLAVARDETWLAYSQIDRIDSDLMLAEPFH